MEAIEFEIKVLESKAVKLELLSKSESKEGNNQSEGNQFYPNLISNDFRSSKELG